MVCNWIWILDIEYYRKLTYGLGFFMVLLPIGWSFYFIYSLLENLLFLFLQSQLGQQLLHCILTLWIIRPRLDIHHRLYQLLPPMLDPFPPLLLSHATEHPNDQILIEVLTKTKNYMTCSSPALSAVSQWAVSSHSSKSTRSCSRIGPWWILGIGLVLVIRSLTIK